MAQSRSGKSSKKSTSSSARSSGRSSSSSSSRSSGSTQRRSTGSASAKKQASRRAQRRAESTNLIRSVILAGLGLLCIVLVLVPGQNLWGTLRGVLYGLFGVLTYLVGPFLLYLAYLVASGYRVGKFSAKVALMGVLCAGVPVVFSKVNVSGANAWQVIQMLFDRGNTGFWEGGVLGAPVGAVLVALFGRPASNALMLLVFVLGLMVFFAVTPLDVVQFAAIQWATLQEKRAARVAETTAYDTPLFNNQPEEEPLENLTGTLGSTQKPHRPAYDAAGDFAAPPYPAASANPGRGGRAQIDVDLGPAPSTQAAQAAVQNDPLAPVVIGPGGTFGLDPLARPARKPVQEPAPRQRENFELQLEPEPPTPQPMPGGVDELIQRAMEDRPPYLDWQGQPEQEVSSEVQLDLPPLSNDLSAPNPADYPSYDAPSEFETPLSPVESEPYTPTPYDHAPLTPEPYVPFAEPTDLSARVPGDTMVISPAELAAASAASAASRPVIQSLGGSFDTPEAAWNAGVPVAEVLRSQSQPAPAPYEPTPYTPTHSATVPYEPASYTPVPPMPVTPAPAAYQGGTAGSYQVPQQGSAAKLRVSDTVGNSATPPISTPPSAAKARAAGVQSAGTQPAAQPISLYNEEEEALPPYCYPSLNLFNASRPEDEAGAAQEMKKNADILVHTLDSFGVKTKILDICRGPSVTRYELQPQAGIKVSRITSLSDDIALNLATAGVRIEAPIPGKPAVGIEVPNRLRSTVNIRTVFESQNYINMRSPLTMALGKDIAGASQVADLCKMPHLLIAGSTGSGKSVCVNSIIVSFLFRSGPEDVKLLLIDPKVVELAEYNGIPHLLMPVVTEPRKAAGALGASVAEMERRYKLFAENNVREIKSYNKLAAQTGLEHLPYIAIVIDELADLMMVAGKEVEDYICRIAQKARAAGIHLIVATQRPSVDVITGLIKANIPSRIAFAVSSQIDSRTILDGGGAEKLLGNGDMLFLPVGAPKPTRVQGTFVTDEEIGAVLSFIKSTSSAQYDEEMIAEMERRAVAEKGSKKGDDGDDAGGTLDAMFEQAVECVIEAGMASTSLLQRRCKLGYARAARIMDQMEKEKVIGPYEGAKPRTVLISAAEWQERKLSGQYD